jgi:hypothetical protein
MLSEFDGIAAKIAEERRQICFADETITFYTARSGDRDLRQFREALAGVAPPRIPLLIAPYTEAVEPLLKDATPFVWISPVSFAAALPADARLVASEEKLQEFINGVGADDNYEIIVPPQWQNMQKFVREKTLKILMQAAARLKTLQHFGRLWPINFTANAPAARRWSDIVSLEGEGAPDALVMAGPSLGASLQALKSAQNIWVADTALPALTKHEIFPQVVFSADAGFASREHFVGTNPERHVLVCDMLVNPGVPRLPFTRICTYAGSHPLVQHFCATERNDLTEIVNPEGNVGSLMLAIYARLFGNRPVKIYGYDKGHRRRVTHARGTAYFQRFYGQQTRIETIETYMLRLSRRYA